MYNQQVVRNRPIDSSGAYEKLLFEGRLTALSGALTTVAAQTATAGYLFTMRWTSTTALCLIRYVNISWIMTTAFGAAQNMGWGLIVARNYSASCTGGTALDLGSTTANTNATRTANGTSQFAANTCRIGATGALTAGTQTLDANFYAAAQKWQSVTLGSDNVLGAWNNATLLDARDDGAGSVVRTPITLNTNEGIVLQNLVLMGATGVGTLAVTVEWDEVALQA